MSEAPRKSSSSPKGGSTGSSDQQQMGSNTRALAAMSLETANGGGKSSGKQSPPGGGKKKTTPSSLHNSSTVGTCSSSTKLRVRGTNSTETVEGNPKDKILLSKQGRNRTRNACGVDLSSHAFVPTQTILLNQASPASSSTPVQVALNCANENSSDALPEVNPTLCVSPSVASVTAAQGLVPAEGIPPAGVSASDPNTSQHSQNLHQQQQSDADLIDPALLSALRDPRERRNLLRLEQLLVDFMNEKHRGFIQVGGGQSCSPSTGGGGGLQNASAAKIQTSFQRLCLHRLADRFGIARESGVALVSPPGPPASSPSQSSGETNGIHSGTTGMANQTSPLYGTGNVALQTAANNSYERTGNNFVMHPIRLVKTRNSRIPASLLIDLDIHNDQSPYSNSGEDNNNSASVLNKSLSSSSFEGSRSIAKSQQERGRMKIMKRNASLNGVASASGNRGDGQGGRGGGRNNLRGKNLSDKEKAYAEARARIFAEQGRHDSDGSSALGGEKRSTTSASLSGRSSNVSSANNSSSSLVDVPQAPAVPLGSAVLSQNAGMDQGVRAISPPHSGNALLDKSEFGDTIQSQEVFFAGQRQEATFREKGGSRSLDQQPKAVAGGAVSKVTWRNRKQEENDPDFRRRRGNMAAMAPIQYAPTLGAAGSHHIVAATPNGHHNHGTSVYGMPAASSDASYSVHSSQNYAQQRHQQYFYTSAAAYVGGNSNGGSGSSSAGVSSPTRHGNGTYAQSNQSGASYFAHSQHQVYYPQHSGHATSQYTGSVTGNVGVYVPSGSASQVGSHRSSAEVGGETGDACSAASNGTKSVYHSEFPALR